MCHEASGSSFDRPLFPEDVPLIAQAYPSLSDEGVHAIYSAITDHHWPQPAVLIAVLEWVHRSIRHDCGLYKYPVMPFSAMDLRTYERVQTDGMYAFHTVFESMALAQRNMELLNNALGKHFGIKVVLFCDCGGCGMPVMVDPFETKWYKQVNQLRSLAEAVGTKVVRVPDFDHQDWISRTLDMGPAETASYTRMFALLQSLPKREVDIHQLANAEFGQLFKEAA